MAENISNNDSVDDVDSQSIISSIINTQLSLILDKLVFERGEIIPVTATLTDDKNVPIPNADIYFLLDEKTIGDSPTNNEGIATAYYDTSTVTAGDHMISVEYQGSPENSVSFDYVQINIAGISSDEQVDENIPEIVDENNTIDENLSDKMNEIPDEVLNNAPQVLDKISEDKIIIENDLLNEKISPTEKCTTERYIDRIPIIEPCVTPPCTGDNESCGENQSAECVVGYDNIEKFKDNCVVDGYVFNDKIKFSTEGYTCTIGKDVKSKVMICDSIYDGNGDGICSSGESCMKFIITADSFEKYEKNSLDKFTPEDDDYFTGRVKTEVLQ